MIPVARLFDQAELGAVHRLMTVPGDPVAAAARAAWSSLTEPGDSVAAVLIERLGAAEAFARVVSTASAAEISALRPGEASPAEPADPAEPAPSDAEVSALAAGLERWRPRLDRPLLLRRLEIAERIDVRLLVPGSEGWLESLDDLGSHAPLLLWVRGDPTAFAVPRLLALVGARAATGYGEHVAAELSAGIAGRGLSVVSGGAFGIDAVAHRAALGTGGRTIAFLAGGADRLYPTAHSELLQRLIATPGCAVAAEVPPGTTPTRWRFLQRNRLIAASTGATVVVEAGARSGSLNTAGHAAALGRPLGAVPGPVTSASSAGCHRLFREYAASCVTSVADVLELAGIEVPTAVPSEGSGSATRVLDALRGRTAHDTEGLARQTGLSVRDALAVLGGLLGEGAVSRHADGTWTKAAGPP
ncbi:MULTISPECIES: DNA-processing protein DprA [unclassified Rathayibacter]|uniref:DNA-processing protein DprA n=1 Tax=unclassified Rathayibacter TaxID=2609250 RepID=UPI00188D31D3|nr:MULTISPECIES: DNA-processing protein DprA [unclassified Rathayibacter]MBF4462168.1 DNA-protecting protein DprA [Rathayibacter sp. VKM Ac-2879]MBF4503789.1 DNA-protecting protein DprA [Rathayibacter sp. VKM Ac-2878]